MMKPLCGFLNLLKPPGMTSAAAVAQVHRLLGGVKTGHAGTLDPEAAGVLPLMIGKATRLFDYLQDKEKAYITEVAFTGSTDTEDAQGILLERCTAEPDEERIRAVLPAFTGDYDQQPPIFSALKQNGTRAYDLARKGETPLLAPRPVSVSSLFLLRMTDHGAMLSVRCSKGFYVRSLCRDIGKALSAPAHMRFLLRTQSGVFTLENAYTLEELRSASANGSLADLLISPQEALPQIPFAEVPNEYRKAVRNGVAITFSAFPSLQHLPQGSPFGLLFSGDVTAIAVCDKNGVKSKTWLGD